MKLLPQVVSPSPLQPVVLGTSRKSCTWGGTVTPVACLEIHGSTTGIRIKLLVVVEGNYLQKKLQQTKKIKLEFHLWNFLTRISAEVRWGCHSLPSRILNLRYHQPPPPKQSLTDQERWPRPITSHFFADDVVGKNIEMYDNKKHKRH